MSDAAEHNRPEVLTDDAVRELWVAVFDRLVLDARALCRPGPRCYRHQAIDDAQHSRELVVAAAALDFERVLALVAAFPACCGGVALPTTRAAA